MTPRPGTAQDVLSGLDWPPTAAGTVRPAVRPGHRVNAASGVEQAVQRAATTADYSAWLDHTASAAGCARPIQLRGESHIVSERTGRIVSTRHTDQMPDGVIYKACGNRRAAVCPSCAETYRGDTYQLVLAGLQGGKGIPATVQQHPCAFATLTAPPSAPSTPRGRPAATTASSATRSAGPAANPITGSSQLRV